MSGVSPSPAEQHLGDRLAALVDGELKHDARERVLAHLATCAKCKAEADAQRRLKTMFVESAPPPLSAGLLARLQGLPGGGPDGPSGPAGPPGPAAADPFEAFAYGLHAAARPQQQGFRIHEVGRPRRRFAFVAAGAVSLAALALGGGLPQEAADPNVRGIPRRRPPGPAPRCPWPTRRCVSACPRPRPSRASCPPPRPRCHPCTPPRRARPVRSPCCADPGAG